MAKKFGKVLLLSAAVASAAAAVYYYMQKKDAVAPVDEDEDFDDFGEDLDEDNTFCPNYVSLTPECSECTLDEDACDSCSADAEEDDFTPLSEQVSEMVEDAVETVEETVEEFFDEDEVTE